MIDLWIGDRVKIIKSGEIAFFEGIIAQDRIKLKLAGGTIIESTTDSIIAIGDENIEPELTFDDENHSITPIAKLKTIENDTVIDLHYDELIKYYKHERGHILDFQLDKCEEFLINSIDRDKNYVKIIHGKGEGVLKQAVEKLLSKYQMHISMKSAHPDGASIDIWLR